MTKNVPKEELHIFLKGLVRNRLELSDPDTDVVSVKLVDERSGEVAAYAQWGFSGDVSFLILHQRMEMKRRRGSREEKAVRILRGERRRMRMKEGICVDEKNRLPKKKKHTSKLTPSHRRRI